MKIEWKTCFRIGLSAFLLFLCVNYWNTAAGFLLTCLKAAVPLLIGCVIAYMVNILMSFYERYYFPGKKSKAAKRTKRPVCMLAAFLTLFAVVALLVKMVVPEFIGCIQLLGVKLSEVLAEYQNSALLSELLPEQMLESLASMDWQAGLQQFTRFLSSGIGGAVGTMTNLVASLFSGIVTWLIGFIFSIYVLTGKEKLQSQCMRVMKRYLPSEWNEKILYVLDILNDSFHRYIVGQCVEAVILGSLCTVGMLILRMPYAVMIGTLIGFTALIPVAGAYIGAGVGAFMILTVSPLKALLFLVFIVVLQQLEGNIIYPRVVGSSVGLPGIWVLAAVTVGGSLSGVLGMLLAVPVAAAFYRILREDMKRPAKPGRGSAS